jgi:hypothetical protein
MGTISVTSNLEISKIPGRGFSSRYLLLIIAAILFLGTLIFTTPLILRFTIANPNNGKVIFECKMNPGDSFKVSYIHSVNRSPIDDYFVIGADYDIILVRTVFRSFGAGVPSEPEPGQVWRQFPDRIEIDRINRSLPDYRLFVGGVSDHRFTFKNRTFHLNRLAPPGTTLRLGMGRISIVTLLRSDLNGQR